MNHSVPTWIATSKQSHSVVGAEMLYVPNIDDRVDMMALMRELGNREVASVLIEGGGETLGSAFAAGIVDKVMFFVAPKILGGREAVPAVGGLGVSTVDQAIRLRDMTATPVGDDILIEAYVDHAKGNE